MLKKLEAAVSNNVTPPQSNTDGWQPITSVPGAFRRELGRNSQ